jgi:hypothetical protein
MHEARSRRVSGSVAVGAAMLLFAACHGGNGNPLGSPTAGPVDVKSACAALAQLRQSTDLLNGVNVGDPSASLTALRKAVASYSASLGAFERIAPVALRPRAEEVRRAVVAHDFTRAAALRAPIDAWANRTCKP